VTQPLPAVSVVVPTRNRPGDAAECVRSILACTGPPFELVIVDQSDGDATSRALEAFSDPRFRIIRSLGRGASAGRNHGISETAAPILAFTDDDCRVPCDWLERVAAAFAADAGLALLCGRVRTPPLAADTYAAEFEAPDIPMTPDLRCGLGDLGISANMAARRAKLAPLGWFDEALSPGTPLPASEDFDLLIRTLGAGLKVRNVASVEVLHLGVRHGGDVRRLRLGYTLSIGACFFKHTRMGDRAARRIFLEKVREYSWGFFKAIATNTRPFGFYWLRSFLSGALATLRFDIDPQTRLFIDRATGRPVRLTRNP
jgi:glycosyltransferase involved in cell wall biosynthesis